MRSDAIVSAIPGAENNAAAANAFLIMPQCSAASDGGYAGWRLRNGDEQLSVVRWLMFHAAMDVRHRFIEVNNVRLHCAEQGEGPTVILLHGFPECWYSWGRQLPALAAAGYHAIAPDMRGYNLSDKPKRGYDIESLVSDVVELARAIAPGDRRVHLVGHDWGGAVAWQVAWRYPSLLHSLTVMNAPHPAAYARYVRRSPGQMLKSSYMLFFQAPWLPEFVLTRKGAAAIASAFRRSTKRAEAFSAADLEVYRTAFLRPGAARAAIDYYRQAVRQGSKVLPSAAIEVPTLVLWGEDDPVLSRALNDGLDAWVKNFTIKFIPNCGHWTQQEQPDVVTSEMLGWFQRASARP